MHVMFICVSQITTDQVSSFTEEVQKFNQKFKEEGPASVGTDLDKGTRKRLTSLVYTVYT